MPAKERESTRTRPRTLAEKLQLLREMKVPRGELPPSYEITARQIADITGVSISGPYFWELVTGRTTNPKLHHLRALAQYFKVPVAYLADDEADFEQLESELELLRSIKVQGVNDSTADLATMQGLLGRIQLLESFGGEEIREMALRLRLLNEDQRKMLDEIAGDPELLAALKIDMVREITRHAFHLSDASQQAALTMVEHLHRTEQSFAAR
ncbi:XRE family transcriptional regulator [Streptomyces sp. 8K308]|uniref:helix-turn-helix domain-containing protein n=1 Tax=Streptomyces sp. 8K308 TaxID=2530388 RepID=UPI00104D8E6A|nr:helix-turn-helix transcriptional regulator [Streptomyces sp. 8K308]TDC15886.1 XRE family transcriptional regulator [Streptomyces sp. 8K308]